MNLRKALSKVSFSFTITFDIVSQGMRMLKKSRSGIAFLAAVSLAAGMLPADAKNLYAGEIPAQERGAEVTAGDAQGRDGDAMEGSQEEEGTKKISSVMPLLYKIPSLEVKYGFLLSTAMYVRLMLSENGTGLTGAAA